MSASYKLWGMDGTFRGNEERMHLVLPAVHDGEHVWLAREAEWNPAEALTGQQLEVRRACEVLTPLDGEVELNLQPGERVLVVGKAYEQALGQLGLLEALCQGFRLVPAGEGAWVGAAMKVAWEAAARHILQRARGCYDAALLRGEVAPTEQAQAAYTAMVGTGLLSDEDFTLLRVVHALWEGAADRAASVLNTGQLIFGLEEGAMRQRANRLLRDVRMKQRQRREPGAAMLPRSPYSPLLSSSRPQPHGAVAA